MIFSLPPRVVPSIAVVAPAYNEEKTVVESVNSLLTLIYPDYQVIVVNDGSADETIEVLKREFQLVRIDKQPEGSLKTAPVKGIYYSPANRRLPGNRQEKWRQSGCPELRDKLR